MPFSKPYPKSTASLCSATSWATARIHSASSTGSSRLKREPFVAITTRRCWIPACWSCSIRRPRIEQLQHAGIQHRLVVIATNGSRFNRLEPVDDAEWIRAVAHDVAEHKDAVDFG